MLYLRDARDGGRRPVRPARPGLLTTYTLGRGGPEGSEDLRVFLLADLISRVAQWHGLRVNARHNVPGGPGAGPAPAQSGEGPGLWSVCRALNIYPAEFTAAPGRFDIGIGAAPAAPADGPASLWVLAGPGGPPEPQPLAAGGTDPLALRLALLKVRYQNPVTVSDADLAAADRELRHWRDRVAAWATHPSKPMDAPSLARAAEALDDDLDTPAALTAARYLADDERLPPGSKFETFAHLDQVLGLDLAREVGR